MKIHYGHTSTTISKNFKDLAVPKTFVEIYGDVDESTIDQDLKDHKTSLIEHSKLPKQQVGKSIQYVLTTHKDGQKIALPWFEDDSSESKPSSHSETIKNQPGDYAEEVEDSEEHIMSQVSNEQEKTEELQRLQNDLLAKIENKEA